MFNDIDWASPKSPAGPLFLIPVEVMKVQARKEESHCTALTKQSLSCVLAVPHASRKSGAKQGGFQGFSRLPTSSIQH